MQGRLEEMSGYGYGDRSFEHACQKCGAVINHEFLYVGKLKGDVDNVILKDWPFGGTILSAETGAPIDASVAEQNVTFNAFPNRLFRLHLRSPVLELINTDAPTMEDVKKLIEKAIADKAVIKGVNAKSVFESGVLQKLERFATRKMMSRYWTNPSIFALELGGAVVRQGVFVDKMYAIDWIHSPAARETMDRVLGKYSRFMKLISAFPSRVGVPTLDVDLAWHTHQLSPKSYFDYTMSKAKKFIDHDDKIEEDTRKSHLSASNLTEYGINTDYNHPVSKHFQWTSRVYEAEYGELYSECTCWYCEGKFEVWVSCSSRSSNNNSSCSSADAYRKAIRGNEARESLEQIPRDRSSQRPPTRSSSAHIRSLERGHA